MNAKMKAPGLFLLFIMLLSLSSLARAETLTLEAAQAYALKHAPEIKALESQAKAFKQSAVAADALPDPKMSLGLMNLPTDSFSFDQENMTQIQIGLMQQFPKGDSLSIRSQQDKLRAGATSAKMKLTQLNVLRTIRLQWLSLYYWHKALVIYQKEANVFAHLTETTQALLANNKLQQKDAVRAQLEASQLKQDILNAKQQIAGLQGALSRWLTMPNVQFSMQLPDWAAPEALDQIAQHIRHLPQLREAQLQSEVGQQGIHLAQQQYKPGFKVGVVYGIRQGRNSMQQRRSDFVGAQITFSLPLFTENLQDKNLQASINRYVSMQAKEQSEYQLLQSTLKSVYADWQTLRPRNTLYQKHLVPEAQMYAHATQIAYQNKQTDFPTLVRAYLQQYKTEMAALKVKVALLKTHVQLMYLEGI